MKKQTRSTSNPKAAKGYTCKQYTRQHTHCSSNFDLFMSFTNRLCLSQFHLRPASPPPPSRGDLRALAFFLPWMTNSRGWGLLSCQIPRGGDKKRGQIPRPPSTPQHFSLIAQSNSVILSILMCDFLFQLTSSFVIALGF